MLKTFVSVMQQGSFAAAAALQNVDPSQISRSISHLEKELGFRLFQRTTRRLSPTEAGAVYFDRVRLVIEDLEQASHLAMDAVSAPQGTLRVTASVSFGQKWLVPRLATIRQMYPALAIELLLTDANVDLIAERIDLAIRLGPRVDSGLIGTVLMPTRYRVVASPAYVKQYGGIEKPEDLSQRDCLLLPLSGYRTRWLCKDDRGHITEVPVHGTLTISTALALHVAALNGLGPTLLADWVIDDDLATGKLIDLLPSHQVTATDFETAVRLLYPSRAYLPLKVRAFIDCLKAGVRLHPIGDAYIGTEKAY